MCSANDIIYRIGSTRILKITFTLFLSFMIWCVGLIKYRSDPIRSDKDMACISQAYFIGHNFGFFNTYLAHKFGRKKLIIKVLQPLGILGFTMSLTIKNFWILWLGFFLIGLSKSKLPTSMNYATEQIHSSKSVYNTTSF